MAAKIKGTVVKRLIQTFVSKNTPAPVSSRPKAAAAVKESFR